MRLFGYGLLAAGLLLAGNAGAQQCLRPADRAAFDAAGLKTQLMITALTCNTRDRYNAFILRFRSDLRNQEQRLLAYFVRRFGARGQREHDDYVTSLANVQSEAGLRDGTLFCQRHTVIFEEVLALPKGADLARYAASKGLAQPIDTPVCAPSPTRTAQARERR